MLSAPASAPLAVDLGRISALRSRLRKNEPPENHTEKPGTFKRALLWTIVWISLAAIFLILRVALGLSFVKARVKINIRSVSRKDHHSKE